MFEKSFMRDALGKPLVEKRFYKQSATNREQLVADCLVI